MKTILITALLVCVAAASASAGGARMRGPRIKLVDPKSKGFQILGSEEPIRDAKQKPFGTEISVSGRVTVSNQFGGPIYLQDGTGGIAVYDLDLIKAVSIGDSVMVTGPYAEFGAGAEAGSGLGQISGENIIWHIFTTGKKELLPRSIAISDIGENIEGELVQLTGVTIGGGNGSPRSFQQNKNYELTDATGTAQLRIDNNTNLVGAPIPEGAISIVGVVGQYMGTYQILPRTTADLGLNIQPNPWDTLSKEKTFDITTWNLEWFGDAQNGPENDSLQFRNVVRVLDSIDADLYGLEEVVSKQLFQRIMDSLPRYGGVYSYGIGQPQKMAYLFKRSVVDSVMSAHVLKTPGTWGSGRYPLLFMFRATVGGETKTIHSFLLHAKATGDVPLDDYQHRIADATALYDLAGSVYRDNNVLILGDFNDDMDVSTFNSQASPYKAFVDNTAQYAVPTKRLSDKGASSYSKGASMLDHVIVSNELAPYVLEGAEKVENVSYIGSYITTTSDHYPVSVRLLFNTATSVQDKPSARATVRIYPDPTPGDATVEFTVQQAGPVRIEIVDALGRTTVLRNAFFEPGTYTLPVAAPGNAGVYVCRLSTGGETIVHRFVVIR